ncbi:acyl-CoA carboxylase subunit beta [Nocardioides sp.]|uniref:acyl-CoA carboxylase subunit beta n=1 Tax=Nocardioides sp. TaxID=35761 RepID=UPI0031FF2D5D|nr:carboxyl transferase [Nocardioides sp.]
MSTTTNPTVPLEEPRDDLGSRAAELSAARQSALEGATALATQAQHAKGKLTARERIALLFDEGTFTEIDAFRKHSAHGFGLERNRPATDGVVVGWGAVQGRRVFVYAHDFRIYGGSLGDAHAQKIHKVMDLAAKAGAPIVGLCDGAGARIQEGVTALAGYGGIFERNVRNSGVIPQISVVLGPCAGGAAYSPALTDFVFMVRGTAQMFITGPDVVASVTGEVISHEDLGGAQTHATTTGVAGMIYDDEAECLEDVRYLLSLLPSNNREFAPRREVTDSRDRDCPGLLDLVPVAPNVAYDVHGVIGEVVDDGEFFEVHERWATNIVCGFAWLDGHVVGIVANQPAVLAGVLDIAASEKAARFVQLCDAFNVPLVTFVDVPGFLPGVTQEHGGVIRHGAKLLYAYCNSTVPRVQVVTRKAYGGAYIVMDSRSIGADVSLAWPTNEIAVMGAEAAVNVLYRREIKAASDPDAERRARMEHYRDELITPYHAAERGLVDDVIDPVDTRKRLIDALDTLRQKTVTTPCRKHGNQPQ